MDSILTRAGTGNQNGYSLTEVVVNLAVASILLTIMLHCVVTIWTDVQRVWREAESQADWSNIARVLTQDGHGSVAASTTGGTLGLRMADGREYRYVLNGAGQLLRIGDNGGVSVIGVDVSTFYGDWKDGSVTASITFSDGSTHSLTCTGVSAWVNS